jgi:hypothetical protein
VKNHLLPFAVALLIAGTLALVSYQLPLGLVSAHAAQGKAAPRSVKKAMKLTRQSAAQLASDYARGYAKLVCAGLTAKARKSLGGNSSCVFKVRLATGSAPISKISIEKIAFRRSRVWADVTGYLNGNRKQRLVVAFKWEGERYRLDRSLSSLRGLFG